MLTIQFLLRHPKLRWNHTLLTHSLKEICTPAKSAKYAPTANQPSSREQMARMRTASSLRFQLQISRTSPAAALTPATKSSSKHSNYNYTMQHNWDCFKETFTKVLKFLPPPPACLAIPPLFIDPTPSLRPASASFIICMPMGKHWQATPATAALMFEVSAEQRAAEGKFRL
ncbi:unnamed protein product [Ceratitis capitata]|uniref:(Mediterranean fruit fly) hypothetical protein n=1 Tax=Ceratitis capitata TaxID=7213 RepID=A0A811U8T4_CERCA|nr:unnamed protein product [Ceratitis capitata]